MSLHAIAAGHYSELSPGVIVASKALEDAVEIVVTWLTEHNQEDLAKAVAVATDPDPPTAADLAEIRSAIASTLGRSGGEVTSRAKAAAARRNGQRGGRPRKAPAD